MCVSEERFNSLFTIGENRREKNHFQNYFVPLLAFLKISLMFIGKKIIIRKKKRITCSLILGLKCSVRCNIFDDKLVVSIEIGYSNRLIVTQHKYMKSRIRKRGVAKVIIARYELTFDD